MLMLLLKSFARLEIRNLVCVYVFLNRSLFLFTTTIQIYSLAGIYIHFMEIYIHLSQYMLIYDAKVIKNWFKHQFVVFKPQCIKHVQTCEKYKISTQGPPKGESSIWVTF